MPCTLASYPSSATPSSTPCPDTPYKIHEYHHLQQELYPLYISTFVPVNTVLAVPGIEPLAVTNAPTPLELYTMATRTVTVTETETVWPTETETLVSGHKEGDVLENLNHYVALGFTVSKDKDAVAEDGTPTIEKASKAQEQAVIAAEL